MPRATAAPLPPPSDGPPTGAPPKETEPSLPAAEMPAAEMPHARERPPWVGRDLPLQRLIAAPKATPEMGDGGGGARVRPPMLRELEPQQHLHPPNRPTASIPQLPAQNPLVSVVRRMARWLRSKPRA